MANVKNVYTTDQVGYGSVDDIYNVSGTRILRSQLEIWHNGLKEHKVLSAPDRYILKHKVNDQVAKWSEKWNEVCEKKKIEDAKVANLEEANYRTAQAASSLESVENILKYSLSVNNVVCWEALKKDDAFSEPYPNKVIAPSYYSYPMAPDQNSPEFQPKINLFSMIFKSLKTKAIVKAENAFNEAQNAWNSKMEELKNSNVLMEKKYQKDMINYNNEVDAWNAKKAEFIRIQNEYNERIDELKRKYFEADVSAILENCGIVLNSSVLPDMFNKDFELDYNPDNKILIIDYMLPNIESFPNIKEVKYIASKNELKVSYQNDAFMEKLFDSTIYRLILRVLNEEFEADIINAIDAISFNGWVNSLNKATGKREDSCIASIQAKKESFVDIELEHVDPKSCFKSLKGVGSSKLAGITPIQPILTINKNDKRFVESHDVTNTFDDSTNLAAIPWEEFEHLIREIFEAEFSSNGGEVKVTQASRDGGVDAVAFDPDPIRGGKIVIQAKRYTNTVGVSAVRDLYGTVMNEGATKGILVTTADYGPDAYEFAKNKPLTLLNGGNLLHLMEKHGHKAKIDLKEAKLLNLANDQS